MLTQLRLRELLEYDPITGVFRSRHTRSKLRTGGIAGVINLHGYRIMSVDGERLRASRLAWLYMTGEWPAEDIDHINGNTADDRWCNLRACSAAENMANSKLLRLNNTSGVRGVYWNKRRWKWHARVRFENIVYHCGYFDTLEDALKARDAKAAQLHGAFAQLNRPSQELPKC